MIDIYSYDMVPLSDFLAEYKELNTNNRFRPVAVGRYGIRTRESIYSKELAQDYSKNKLIYKDTLTVGMGSVQMDIGILTDDITYSVSPAYHTYRINGINCDYLRFCLQARNADMFERYKKRGSRQGKSIDLKAWLHYLIPVYEIDGQLQIVSTLHKIQSIIDDRMQQLQKLDDLVKARFVEMFGDPENNSFDWKEQPLSKHLDVVGGFAFKSDQFVEEGIPVLRIGNINAGYFKPVNMVFWDNDDNLKKYKLFPGDLVMSLTGTVGKDDYGNVCILGNDYDEYYLNQRNAKLELKDSINKYYISTLLKFESIKKKLTGISRGIRQANISNKDILNLVVPIPNITTQIEFEQFVQQVDKSKFVESIHVLKLIKEAIAKEVSHDRIR